MNYLQFKSCLKLSFSLGYTIVTGCCENLKKRLYVRTL